MVGLDDLKVLFQHKWFYDSMKLKKPSATCITSQKEGRAAGAAGFPQWLQRPRTAWRRVYRGARAPSVLNVKVKICIYFFSTIKSFFTTSFPM